MQMAGRLFWEVHPDGSVRTDGLHLEGFARILWDALRCLGTRRLRRTRRWRPCSWECPAVVFKCLCRSTLTPGVGRPEHGRGEHPVAGVAGGGCFGSA
jgi:hypothetical protein